MFRSDVFLFILIIAILMTMFVNGRNLTGNRRRHMGSTRKPVRVKICGPALIRMLDMVCTKARQLLMQNELSSSAPAKRQFNIDDDLFSRTVSIADYARKFISDWIDR